MEIVTRMVSENPLVIYSKSSTCPVSFSVKSLLHDFGVNPTVFELDEIPKGQEIAQALSTLGHNPVVPIVFIGDEFVGGANEFFSLHLKRDLEPMLIRAGVKWV